MDWSGLLSWNEYAKLLIGLFAVSTPLAAIPVFLSLSAELSEQARKAVATTACVTYAAALLGFAYLGKSLLAIFGITIAAFKVAGGILLLLSALDMLRPAPEAVPTVNGSDGKTRSIGVVPLAMPLLAGPGAISTVVIFADYGDSVTHGFAVSCIIVLNTLAIFFLFRTALRLGPWLGSTTTTVITRVMGLIVASIAIEFVLDGIAEHFPQLIIAH